MHFDILRALPGICLGTLIVLVLNYVTYMRGHRRREAARQHAIDQALIVEEVERDTIWTQGQSNGTGLRASTVVRYSVKPRRAVTATWSFLQRWDEERDTRFPGHWRLHYEAGEPTQAQIQVLHEIAADVQWARELMEVEFQPDRISIYWAETGIEGARKVAGYLRQLDG